MEIVHKRPMKILVIEDEPSVRLGLCSALKQAGHDVGSAGNAPEGIALFRENQHDLVVTDMVMPGGNGMEILAAVKEIAPKTGVIVMTAFDNPESERRCRQLSVDHYLRKPFDLEAMLGLIRGLLGGSGSGSGVVGLGTN